MPGVSFVSEKVTTVELPGVISAVSFASAVTPSTDSITAWVPALPPTFFTIAVISVVSAAATSGGITSRDITANSGEVGAGGGSGVVTGAGSGDGGVVGVGAHAPRTSKIAKSKVPIIISSLRII